MVVIFIVIWIEDASHWIHGVQSHWLGSLILHWSFDTLVGLTALNCSAHCALCTVYCTLHLTAQCTVEKSSPHCALHSVELTALNYSAHCALCTVHCTVEKSPPHCALHSSQCRTHRTLHLTTQCTVEKSNCTWLHSGEKPTALYTAQWSTLCSTQCALHSVELTALCTWLHRG